MKKYSVVVTETLKRTVNVMAESPCEAEELVYDLCNAGVIDLGAEDFEDRYASCKALITPMKKTYTEDDLKE